MGWGPTRDTPSEAFRRDSRERWVSPSVSRFASPRRRRSRSRSRRVRAGAQTAPSACPAAPPVLTGPSAIQAGETYSVSWTNVLANTGAGERRELLPGRARPRRRVHVGDGLDVDAAFGAHVLRRARRRDRPVPPRLGAARRPPARRRPPSSRTSSPCPSRPSATRRRPSASSRASPENPPAFSTWVISWNTFGAGPGPGGGFTDLKFRIRRTSALEPDGREWVVDGGSASFTGPPGDYVFEVRAEAACGAVGPWSPPKKVTVGTVVSPSLVLVSEPAPIAFLAPLSGAKVGTSFTVRNAGTDTRHGDDDLRRLGLRPRTRAVHALARRDAAGHGHVALRDGPHAAREDRRRRLLRGDDAERADPVHARGRARGAARRVGRSGRGRRRERDGHHAQPREYGRDARTVRRVDPGALDLGRVAGRPRVGPAARPVRDAPRAARDRPGPAPGRDRDRGRRDRPLDGRVRHAPDASRDGRRPAHPPGRDGLGRGSGRRREDACPLRVVPERARREGRRPVRGGPLAHEHRRREPASRSRSSSTRSAVRATARRCAASTSSSDRARRAATATSSRRSSASTARSRSRSARRRRR